MVRHIWSLRSFRSTVRFGFFNPLDWWWRIASMPCCLRYVPGRCSICVYSISLYAAAGYCGLQILGWRGRMQMAQSFVTCSVYVSSFGSRRSMRERRRPVWVSLYFYFILAALRRVVSPLCQLFFLINIICKMSSGVFPHKKKIRRKNIPPLSHEGLVDQCVGVMSWTPHQKSISAQILMVKRHLKWKCAVDFRT